MSDSFSEHTFLAKLRGMQHDPRLIVPIGDDAALFRGAGGDVLLAADAVVEGRHCEAGPDAASILARKVVRSNLSDIAAMGGVPESLLLNLILPDGAGQDLADEIVAIVEAECSRYGVALAGGDTVCAGELIVLAASVTGRLVADPVTRAGAQMGDLVVVTGPLGGSILGHHANFEPRLDEAAALVRLGPPSAMADISDGFLRDLQNICDLSGCGARIDAEKIPVSEAAQRLAETTPDKSPLDHALYDGEDFELLFTISPERFETLLVQWNMTTKLVVTGTVVESGLWLAEGDSVRPVQPGGFDHGAESGKVNDE